jgi:hypothetical protein
MVAAPDFPAFIAAGSTAADARTAIGAQDAATAVTDSDTATTTVAGIVELATTSEATTGTDTVRAVTPAGVKAVTDALVASDTLVQTSLTENTGIERTSGTSGPLVSLKDGTGTIMLGIDRSGNLVINGTNQRMCFFWQTGDPDPTVGGTKSLPPGVSPVVSLATIGDLPSWMTGKKGLVLVNSGGGGSEVVVGKFYASGIADNTTLTTGSGGGSGDTTVSSVTGTGTASAQTDEGTVNPAIQFTTSSTSRQLVFSDGTAVGTASQRTVSFLLKTPSSFTTTGIVQLLLSGTLEARLTLTGTGALRLVDSASSTVYTSGTNLSPSTWYHVLYQVVQGAGATGTARVRCWPRGNAQTDTPTIDSSTVTGLTLGTTHDSIGFGPQISSTLTLYMANLRWNNDATSYLGNG